MSTTFTDQMEKEKNGGRFYGAKRRDNKAKDCVKGEKKVSTTQSILTHKTHSRALGQKPFIGSDQH